MAIAGSMTTAYSMTPGPGTRPSVSKTTYPGNRCTPPTEAVAALLNWTPASPPVIVQGSDMMAFWLLWEGNTD